MTYFSIRMLIFTICATIIFLSISAMKNTELCSFLDAKTVCRRLHRDEAKGLMFPESACLERDCSNCYQQWKTVILAENGSMTQPSTFIASLLPKEGGGDVILSCKKQGFDCECSNGERCDGTPEFCSVMPCIENATCNCKTLSASTTVIHSSKEGVIEKPRLLSFLTCDYEKATLNSPISPRRHRRAHRHLLENEDAIFEQHGIIIKYNEPVFTISEIGTLIVRVNGHERIFSLKNERTQVVIPEEFLKFKATLKFIFISIHGKVVRGDMEIEGRNLCRRVTCIFCLELFDQIECWPPLLRYFIYGAAVLITALIAVYVKTVLSMAFSTLKAIIFIIRQTYRLVRGGGRLSLSAGAALGNRIRHTAANIQGRLDEEANIPLTLVALLSLIVLANADCTGHIILKTEQQVCADVENGIDCRIETHAQITLPNLEYSQCLWLESTKGEPLVSLKFELVKAECQWQTSRNYYTYFTEFRQINAVYCPNSDMCGWGIHCKTNKRFHAETKESNSYPGFSACVAASAAANKCFVIDSEACHFYRLYLVPDYTKIYEVKSIIGHTCSYQINLIENSNDSQTVEKIVVRSQATTKKGVHLQIIGAYDQPTLLLKQHLISRVGKPDEAYIDNACDTGRPEAGSIGDVQANQTIAQNFIFDKKMFECNFYEDIMNCEKRSSYLEQMVMAKTSALPKTVAYHQLYVDSEGKLMSSMLHTSPLVIALHLRNYKIHLQLKTVCPKFAEGEAKAKGCYACAPLAKLVFTAYSLCKDGPATVTFESISVATRVVTLTTKPSELTIEFHSNTKCVTDKICLHGRTVQACKVIKFCLEEGTLDVYQPNYTYLTSKQINWAYTSPWEWLKLPVGYGLGGILKYAIAGIPLLAVGIFIVAALVTTCCR